MSGTDGTGAHASLVDEVARLRKRDVDLFVTRKIDFRDGEVTTEEVEQWEALGYRRWREAWPLLNDLLFPCGDGEPEAVLPPQCDGRCSDGRDVCMLWHGECTPASGAVRP